MMKNILFIFSLLLFYGCSYNKKEKSSINDLPEFVIVDMITNLRYYEFLSNGMHIDKNIELEDIGTNILLLEDIIKDNTLIYRFTETNCDICIDIELEKIKKIEENHPEIKIILLISVSNNRKIKVIKNKHNLSSAIYNISSRNLYFPIEEANVSYYFILNSNFLAESFFCPIKENTEYTNTCLQAIIKKLQNYK